MPAQLCGLIAPGLVGNRGKTRGSFYLVMAGLVPAIPLIGALCPPIEIAGTSPTMTNRPLRVLLLAHKLRRLRNCRRCYVGFAETGSFASREPENGWEM